MFLRNLLLILGCLCLIEGVALSVVWFNQLGNNSRINTNLDKPALSLPAVLMTIRAVPAGTLLRPEDIGWKEVAPGEVRPGNLVRGQISETELVGAISRRAYAANEVLIEAEFVKPSERQFLAALLKPDTRAVSISVDAPQSAAGLILPGDRVDVILTQNLNVGDSAAAPGNKWVSETVLRNVRIIAVDQSLSTAVKPGGTPRAILPMTEARAPKTVTFELTERQAERLFVAAQLGRLQFSVRPLEAHGISTTEDKFEPGPTWASDVSRAVREFAHKPSESSSTVDKSVRKAPVSTGPQSMFDANSSTNAGQLNNPNSL